MKTIRGTAHGREIEPDEDLGLAEGQQVEIEARIIQPGQVQRSGDGLLRREGALADDREWDAIMEEIHLERRLGR